jgi:hypothetical protein
MPATPSQDRIHGTRLMHVCDVKGQVSTMFTQRLIRNPPLLQLRPAVLGSLRFRGMLRDGLLEWHVEEPRGRAGPGEEGDAGS